MVLFYSNFHVVCVNNIRTEIIMWSNRGSVGGILGCGSGSELGCHLSWAFLHLRGLQKWFLWLMSSEMVLMSYVFRNGSYVLYLQKWFLCLMSSEMVLMSYVQFPRGMCENKNAKHHRIRGWHIGLWQRKLVGVCHLGWALPISSARGGLFADKCSQPAVWFRLLRKTNRNTDRNANTQIYIYKFTYIHKSHQGGQGTVICSDKWLNWPQPPMSVPWLHKQNCNKNVTCGVVQKHLPVKVIHVVNLE